MTRNIFAVLGIFAMTTVPVFAANTNAAANTNTTVAANSQLETAFPGAPYEKVSLAIKGLPDFIPTMGMVYVEPKNLPGGPYLGYSRQGKLVDTVYMVPIKDFNAHQNIPGLLAPAGQVDHVGVYFNPGHAGMAEPHYHIVLWHVPKSEETLVAK